MIVTEGLGGEPVGGRGRKERVMEVGGENDLGMLCICIKIAG
jgi:hypothetical protein